MCALEARNICDFGSHIIVISTQATEVKAPPDAAVPPINAKTQRQLATPI
jgi:hypothetical protein